MNIISICTTNKKIIFFEFANDGKAEKKIEIEMGDPATYTNKNQFAQLEISYKTVKDKISTLNKEYEQIFEQVMEIEAKL